MEGTAMKKILSRRPSPAVIIAIIALVVALTGTAVAGGGFLTKKKFNKFKSQAVQRLSYVNSTVSVPQSTGSIDYTKVSASCPGGLHPVGGGVSLSPNDSSFWWGDGYLTATGYAAHVFNGLAGTVNATATVTVACVAGNASGAPAAS
jgi:hypothetical protein